LSFYSDSFGRDFGDREGELVEARNSAATCRACLKSVLLKPYVEK
jgi:hypothetical protein